MVYAVHMTMQNTPQPRIITVREWRDLGKERQAAIEEGWEALIRTAERR